MACVRQHSQAFCSDGHWRQTNPAERVRAVRKMRSTAANWVRACHTRLLQEAGS